MNLIFPVSCFICDTPVARHQDCGLCDGCWNKTLAQKITPPQCASCGLSLHNFGDREHHLCGNCIFEIPPYAGARSFGHYSSELAKIIQQLKFKRGKNLAGLLGSLLKTAFLESWNREDFDLIVPVPLHPGRRRERGFNQSELLARFLANQIMVPCSSALIRVRATRPQVGLTDSERKENMRNAFRCSKPKQVFRKRILLVDDVMTTGATAASAAQALLDDGRALRVSVLTVARAEK